MATNPKRQLTAALFRSEEWKAVEEYATERIETLRGELEGRLGQDETNAVRGRLSELRLLLRLSKSSIAPAGQSPRPDGPSGY